jgi:hypothetical protein
VEARITKDAFLVEYTLKIRVVSQIDIETSEGHLFHNYMFDGGPTQRLAMMVQKCTVSKNACTKNHFLTITYRILGYASAHLLNLDLN